MCAKFHKYQFSIKKSSMMGGNFTPNPVSDYEVKIRRWEQAQLNLLSLLIH